MTELGSFPSRWGESDRLAVREVPFLRCPDLPWSDWAMRPAAIALIADEMRRGRLAVVELGSGISTVVLARAARELGARIVSFEHDREWADGIRSLLRRERLEPTAAVIDAPLARLPRPAPVSASAEFRAPAVWYEPQVVRAASPKQIELLVVDGPPAADSPQVLVRSPAVPELAGLLADSHTVVLDDISRAAERHAAEQWARALDARLDLPPGTELGVLRSG